MPLSWLYGIPLWLGICGFGVLFVLFSWGVLLLLRPWVLRVSEGKAEWDRVLGYAVAVYGVLYGVTLAMIAAGAYQDFTEVDDIVLAESSSIAVLYRDAAGLPEPARGQLQDLLVSYTRQVVEVEWPQQQQGELPAETVDDVDAMQGVLFGFEPQTLAQVAVQQEAVDAFNQFVADRRARIAVTDLRLPGVLWVVLGLGAVLNVVLLALIEVRSVRVHLIMAGLISAFIAVVIYAIGGFDHPYSGPVAITPEYYASLLADLFAPTP